MQVDLLTSLTMQLRPDLGLAPGTSGLLLEPLVLRLLVNVWKAERMLREAEEPRCEVYTACPYCSALGLVTRQEMEVAEALARADRPWALLVPLGSLSAFTSSCGNCSMLEYQQADITRYVRRVLGELSLDQYERVRVLVDAGYCVEKSFD